MHANRLIDAELRKQKLYFLMAMKKKHRESVARLLLGNFSFDATTVFKWMLASPLYLNYRQVVSWLITEINKFVSLSI